MARSLAVLAYTALAVAVEPPRQPHQPYGKGDRILTYNETTPVSSFVPESISVRWASIGPDGQYITSNDDGDLVVEHVQTGNSSVFLKADKLPADTLDFWISNDEERVLVAANSTPQYRYSYRADYFVVDIESGEKVPLVDDQAGDIQYAELAPTGDAVAFVRGNDIYLRASNGTVMRVTDNGGPLMFNGVPDWVYEEEIFLGRSLLWFSPDAKYLAFLSFNETGVHKFTIPHYTSGQGVPPAYPYEVELLYPKVGTPNPTVQVNLANTETGEVAEVPVDAFAADDLIIGEVSWVTDRHSAVIYRAFNRAQNKEKLVVVDPETKSSKTVRERDGSDGWLDNMQAITYLGRVQAKSAEDSREYYLDLSDESGWMHLYLHSVDGGDPVQLTQGDWEVMSISHVDAKRGLVYYTATTHHSTERHLYSVSLRSKEVKPLVDDEETAFWSASFSAGGSYYILSYLGPDIPYQELYSVNSTKPLATLTSNADFYARIDEYALPNVTYFELEHPDGYSMNVLQQLPPNFDPSKKYPVFFSPYNGPGSISVTQDYHPYGWQAYISCDPELEYVVYLVDGRGTGGRGRAYRSAVAGRLGELEPADQAWAAQELARRNAWLDTERVAMWGWSFGGYLTAKTIEQQGGGDGDSDGIFTLGLLTAPVADWRFYDSMYAERYMGTYGGNEAAYNASAVHASEGFGRIAGGFSVLHGTGDDNVHYQNTAALVDLLVGAGVPPGKMKTFSFTDSDHTIAYHGASDFLYRFLTERLWDEVQRKPGEAAEHQWS